MRRRSGGGSSGQAIAEFALVLPILILVMLAVFDVGRAVLQYTGLTNAAREGARLAIVNQDVALVEARIEAMTFASDVSNIGSAVTFVRQSDGSECDPISVGCLAIVEPTSDWTAITPIIGNIIGPVTFTARAEMPIEFVCPNPRVPQYVSSAACPKQP